jgi:Ni2+-binding GTPase involved in maturation of urease and hydrogenase
MGYEGIDLAFLENVGNLICPAEFDTGAGLNVMILSVPEGDDKPLKYPLMFQKSDALVISKIDALPYFDFNMEVCVERAKALNPAIRIFPVSAKTGEGMEEWENGCGSRAVLKAVRNHVYPNPVSTGRRKKQKRSIDMKDQKNRMTNERDYRLPENLYLSGQGEAEAADPSGGMITDRLVAKYTHTIRSG